MRLLACLIVAPQRGYDEPAILSFAISSFCPTSADGLQCARCDGDHESALLTREQPPRQTGNLPAGGLVGAALIHGTAFFGQPPIRVLDEFVALLARVDEVI